MPRNVLQTKNLIISFAALLTGALVYFFFARFIFQDVQPSVQADFPPSQTPSEPNGDTLPTPTATDSPAPLANESVNSQPMAESAPAINPSSGAQFRSSILGITMTVLEPFRVVEGFGEDSEIIMLEVSEQGEGEEEQRVRIQIRAYDNPEPLPLSVWVTQKFLYGASSLGLSETSVDGQEALRDEAVQPTYVQHNTYIAHNKTIYHIYAVGTADFFSQQRSTVEKIIQSVHFVKK